MEKETDLLVCGACQRDFPLDKITSFLTHKKFDCDDLEESSRLLYCQSCPERFATPWRLLQHAQNIHEIGLYLENSLISQVNNSFSSQSFMIRPDNTNDVLTISSGIPETQSSFYQDKPQAYDDESSDATSSCCTRKHERDTCCCKNCDIQMRDIPKCCLDNMAKKAAKNSPCPRVCCSNKVDVGTQANDVSIDEQNDEDEGKYCCCSNQNCGVTVMPGTHEQLKKCCNAVVPKKRKRHMETKHNASVLLRKRKTFDKQRAASTVTSGGDIFIDVETSGPDNNSVVSENSRGQNGNRGRATLQMSSPGNANKQSKQRSVIIQPGTTFSIPVSYSVMQPSMIFVNNTRNNSVISTSEMPFPSVQSDLNNQNVTANENMGSPGIPVLSPPVINDLPISSNQMNTASESQVIYSLPLPPAEQTQVEYTSNQIPSQNTQHYDESEANYAMYSSNNETNSSELQKSKDAASMDTLAKEILSLVMSVSEAVDRENNNSIVLPDTQNDEYSSSSNNDRGTSEERTAMESALAAPQYSTSGEADASIEDVNMSDQEASQDASGNKMKKRRYPTSRPFKCDQCSQAFNQRIHLRKHQSKHTGIKPFKCGQCDYSTVERSHLKVHIRVHTGEKPYKCTYCEYATAQNSTLKIHLKRHHDGARGSTERGPGLTCRTCGKKFKQQETLETHYRQHGSVTKILRHSLDSRSEGSTAIETSTLNKNGS